MINKQKQIIDLFNEHYSEGSEKIVRFDKGVFTVKYIKDGIDKYFSVKSISVNKSGYHSHLLNEQIEIKTYQKINRDIVFSNINLVEVAFKIKNKINNTYKNFNLLNSSLSNFIINKNDKIKVECKEILETLSKLSKNNIFLDKYFFDKYEKEISKIIRLYDINISNVIKNNKYSYINEHYNKIVSDINIISSFLKDTVTNNYQHYKKITDISEETYNIANDFRDKITTTLNIIKEIKKSLNNYATSILCEMVDKYFTSHVTIFNAKSINYSNLLIDDVLKYDIMELKKHFKYPIHLLKDFGYIENKANGVYRLFIGIQKNIEDTVVYFIDYLVLNEHYSGNTEKFTLNSKYTHNFSIDELLKFIKFLNRNIIK